MNTVHIKNKKLSRPALVVVSAKEHGKVYELDAEGNLSLSEYVVEHPPGYSDTEGFFFRSGDGQHYGSGAPREEDDERNLERYLQAISDELQQHIKHAHPKALYVFEPEHLHGRIEQELQSDELTIETVKEGNFVNHPVAEIAALLEAHGAGDEVDPADPASVAGEENAEEKRKLLEVAQLRNDT